MRFFKTLSGFFEQTAQSQKYLDGDYYEAHQARRDQIDEHLFVEALALTAFEIVYQEPQPSDAEKIILLMERLNHSQGPSRVLKAYGKTRFLGLGTSDGSDLLHFIRVSHPEYFGYHSLATKYQMQSTVQPPPDRDFAKPLSNAGQMQQLEASQTSNYQRKQIVKNLGNSRDRMNFDDVMRE